jgi:hypothetical protein
MSRPETKRASRAIAAAVAFGALLAGCSDMYYDRRETVSLGANDAVASNMVEQMVDPWPRYSNNNNLAFNGERMQRAVECYRKDKVTQPADLNPSTDSAAPPPVTGDSCAGQMTSGSAQPANGAAVAGTNSGSH